MDLNHNPFGYGADFDPDDTVGRKDEMARAVHAIREDLEYEAEQDRRNEQRRHELLPSSASSRVPRCFHRTATQGLLRASVNLDP